MRVVLKKLFEASIVRFVSIKYIGLGMQFIIALYIAKYLGLFYFGIYSFACLVLQYFSFLNLGVNYSLNVLISTEKTVNIKNSQLLLFNSILISCWAGIIILFIMLVANFLGLLGFFDKYLFIRYFYFILLILIFKYINTIYLNVYRIFNKLDLLNISTLVPLFFQIVCLFFFKNEELFWALLTAMLLSEIVIFLLYFKYSPVPFLYKFDKPAVGKLIKKGLSLLIYNLSFYFILITARTIVSYFYKVEEFGLFNFANSISASVMIVIDSFAFLVVPKMLNKFSNLDNNASISFIDNTRNSYLTMTFLVVFVSIVCLPIIFMIIPKYKDSVDSIIILLIAQLIIANTFGYSTLLVQKGKEKLMSIYGFISIGIIIIFGIFIAKYLRLNFNYVALSVVLSLLVYNFLIIYEGNKITKQFKSNFELLKYVFNYKYFVPLLIYSFIYKLNIGYFISIAFTITIYLIINYNDIKSTIIQGKNIIFNSNSLAIKIES